MPVRRPPADEANSMHVERARRSPTTARCPQSRMRPSPSTDRRAYADADATLAVMSRNRVTARLATSRRTKMPALQQRVGFIGLGLMGHGMAKNLIAKGFPLTVRAHRNRKPLEDLLASGAK